MKEKDINIKIQDTILNIRAVAIIIHDNKVLFQKRKQDKYWALPGGKIKVREQAENTIKREIKEELEISNFTVEKLSSISEYFFTFNNNFVHQYIFSYIVSVNDGWILKEKDEFNGKEKNQKLIFKWISLDTLKETPIKPDFVRQQIDNIKNDNIMFISYIEE